MTSCFRHMTALALALLITVTSVTFAAARGQSPAVGTMKICTGTGPIHILVDENGEPTGGVMICPDFAQAFFADVWTEGPTVQPVSHWQAMWIARGPESAVSTILAKAQARGPPVRV